MIAAYLAVPVQTVTVPARSQSTVRLPVAQSAHWYDVSVKVMGQADWLRRLAGHVETGQASISDPAMEGTAKAEQYRVIG